MRKAVLGLALLLALSGCTAAPQAAGGALGERARDGGQAVLHVAVRCVDAHELLVAVEIAESDVHGLLSVEPCDCAAAHLVAAKCRRVPRAHDAVVAAAGLHELL